MDEVGFDNLTRAFARRRTRRAAIRLIGGVITGGLASRRVGEVSAARNDRCATTAECGPCLVCQPGRNGRPGTCAPDPATEGFGCGGDCGTCKNGRCLHDDDLCTDCDRCDARSLTCVSRCPATQICCDGRCQRPDDASCAPPNCVIDGTVYLGGGINPYDTCQSCVPTKDSWTSWNTTRADGEPCSTIAPLKCENGAGFCLSGDCVRDPLPDGAFCGEGQECCQGNCCETGSGCGDNGCVPGCLIESVFYPDGSSHPNNACQVCLSSNSADSWSRLSDTSCGENGDRVCCGGECCGAGACCALDQVCEPCDCTIDGIGYSRNTLNPANECELCDPDASATTWSPDSDVLCGPNHDQVCCGGVCCAAGECCALDLVCEACDCQIDGQGYSRNTLNPANACEICDPDRDPGAWSPDSDVTCGSGGGQVCCGGVCCAPGECCALDQICEACDCVIDGVGYGRGTLNPTNECAACNPSISTTDWSPETNVSCGSNHDQICCGGVCCGLDECCNADGRCEACEPGCAIDGVDHAAGATNPDNACEVCDPAVSATSWTIVPNDSACGGSQVCCNGICCNPNWCCSPFGNHSCDIETCGIVQPCAGLDPCGCTIDGVFYPVGAENPANDCQYCLISDDSASALVWTNRSANLLCGTERRNHCCNGVCCEPGACCNPAGACEIGGSIICGGCAIDGVHYRVNESNPADPCQVCVPELSVTSWSPVCSDACCAPLFCVHDGGSHCGPRP